MMIKEFQRKIREISNLISSEVTGGYSFLSRTLIVEFCMAIMVFMVLLVVMEALIVSFLVTMPYIASLAYVMWPRIYSQWENIDAGQNKDRGWKRVYDGGSRDFGGMLSKFGMSVFVFLLITALIALLCLWYFHKMPGWLLLASSFLMTAVGAATVLRHRKYRRGGFPEERKDIHNDRVLLFYFRFFAIPASIINGVYLITFICYLCMYFIVLCPSE